MNAISQNGYRKSGRVGIERDERAERVERHLHGQSRILKRDIGHGELAGKCRAREPAQPRRVVRTKPGGSGIGRHQARFQHARHGLGIASLTPRLTQMEGNA